MADYYYDIMGGRTGPAEGSPAYLRNQAMQKVYELLGQAQQGVKETTTKGTTPELTTWLQQLGQPQTTTEKIQYGISPEVLKYISESQEQIKGLAAQDPYAEMYRAYNDVIQQLGQSYASRGSRGAAATRQSALSTGLTPLEATSLGEESWMEALRQYYQQMPEVRLQQAGLQAKRWQDLAGLQGTQNQLAQILAGAAQPVETTRAQTPDVAQIIQALTQLAPTTTTQTGGNTAAIIQALVSMISALQPSGKTTQYQAPTYEKMPYGGTYYGGIAGMEEKPTTPTGQAGGASATTGYSETDLDYLLNTVFGGQSY